MYCELIDVGVENCKSIEVGAPLRKPEMKIRKNIRLKNYNYKSKGLYFITICTNHMQKIFGKIIENKMILNNFGIEIVNIINSFSNEHYKIDYYQIMPNHIHLIIEIIKDNEIELSKIIYHFKSKCTNLLKYKNMWQRNYFERIKKKKKEYYNIIRYIINNPYEPKHKW